VLLDLRKPLDASEGMGVSWIQRLLPRKPLVQIPSGADEGEVGEGLREIAKVFATQAQLFRVKAKMRESSTKPLDVDRLKSQRFARERLRPLRFALTIQPSARSSHAKVVCCLVARLLQY